MMMFYASLIIILLIFTYIYTVPDYWSLLSVCRRHSISLSRRDGNRQQIMWTTQTSWVKYRAKLNQKTTNMDQTDGRGERKKCSPCRVSSTAGRTLDRRQRWKSCNNNRLETRVEIFFVPQSSTRQNYSSTPKVGSLAVMIANYTTMNGWIDGYVET